MSSGIWSALRERFAAPAYAYFEEVRNGTGYTRTTRTADALAFGLWPSRGLFLHGIEVKVARSDWKRELADPEKAEEIGRFCDLWWLATTEGVARPEEIPELWGWLELNSKGKLKVRKEAPRRQPEAFTRPFLASLFRQLYNREEALVRAQVDKRLIAERAREREVFEQLRTRALDAERDRFAAQNRLSELTVALGLELDEKGQLTDAGRERVELFRESRAERLKSQLQQTAERLRDLAIEARAVLRSGGVRTRKPAWRRSA